MKILISNSSEKPLYQQIKGQIIEAVLRGDLPEGYALPSIRSFSNDIGVSVLTIRRVYDELEQEGFTKSHVGIGTFIAAGNIELLLNSKRHMVEKKMQELIDMAKELGIPKEELNGMMDILFDEV